MKNVMDKSIRYLTGFGIAVGIAMGTFTVVPDLVTTVYATTNEPTIRVGLPNADVRNKSEFIQRYTDYTIHYNDTAYTAATFFDTFKGLDFGITKTTTGKNKAITVTLRTGASTQTAPTTTVAAPVAVENTTVTSEEMSDTATNTIVLLGREGYNSDIEYMLSDEYTEAVRQEFYRLINAHRKEHGLRELEVNLELQDYADMRAAECRIKDKHIRPDGSPAGSGWHDSQNFMNTRYSENEAGSTRFNISPKEHAAVHFNRWKNSDGHNKHMLYDFDSNITMAFGIAPQIVRTGDWVASPAIFAAGY